MVQAERASNRGLAPVLQALSARPGVQAAVLASSDGLPIERSGTDRCDHDTLAALSATVAQHAARLGVGVGRGVLAGAVLEFSAGCAVLARAGADAWLVLLTEPGADLGALLVELRRQRPALAVLLG